MTDANGGDMNDTSSFTSSGYQGLLDARRRDGRKKKSFMGSPILVGNADYESRVDHKKCLGWLA